MTVPTMASWFSQPGSKLHRYVFTGELASGSCSNAVSDWNYELIQTGSASCSAAITSYCANEWYSIPAAQVGVMQSATNNVVTVSSDGSLATWIVWNRDYWENIAIPAADTQPLDIHWPVERRVEAAARDQAAREQAAARATTLLKLHLNREQRETFDRHKHFIVHSHDGQRRYRVEYGIAGNVKLLGPGDRVVAKFCIHPPIETHPCPTEDVMLAQKLLLETDEAQFLKIANRTALAA